MMDENISSRCVVCSAVRASDVCPVDWMRPLVICEYLGLAHVTLPVGVCSSVIADGWIISCFPEWMPANFSHAKFYCRTISY
jgi:hypothetical protein